MSKEGTRIAAVMCCYFMHRNNYHPKTIVNVGIGSAPELHVWRWLLPDAALLGIDPRGPSRWPQETYVKAGAGDGSRATLDYCRTCRSTACAIPEHQRRFVSPMVTIDAVAKQYKPPYFLWLDCEGGELAALQGASQTLKNTHWLNLEIRKFAWDPEYPARLEQWLDEAGFVLHMRQQQNEDCLYRKRRGKVP